MVDASKARPLLACALAAASLLLGGLVAARATLRAWGPEPTRSSGPWYRLLAERTPQELVERADALVVEGAAALDDRSLHAAERLGRYRRALESAEALLERSLAIRPGHAATLSRWVAVHWELNPQSTARDRDELLEMVALVGRLGPGRADIHQRLGLCLIRHGHRAEGLAQMARAVEIDPRYATEIVTRLEEALFAPEEMLAGLPQGAATLAALAGAYLRAGRADEFAEIVRPHLGSADAALLERFTQVSLRARSPTAVVAELRALGPRPDPAVEAERRVQLSHALLREGRAAAALDEARRAVALEPESVGRHEHLGRAALAADRAGDAVEAFRAALHLASRQRLGGGLRARLYREIGQAEERAGAAGRAYDAYRFAVELDPAEAVAARRLAEMQAAAERRRAGAEP